MFPSLRRLLGRVLILALALLMAAPVAAQVGGTPAPPVTLWQFLGIPQGVKKLQGATRNRRGNRPGLEPKPPMRAIADPRNLESPDPSVKKAAEVKMAEDLKPQKIKAVKFLASIGCGCYDQDGGVTAALVASMQDCTEDVRYATIQAVSEAAQNGSCERCGDGCCCNKEILTALAKIAYERGDDGCYLEPSERVRQAAADALVVCCPNSAPPVIVPGETVAPADDGRETVPDVTPAPRETAPIGPSPLPPPPAPLDPTVAAPMDATGVAQLPMLPLERFSANEPGTGGVVVHVSAPHRLAHVHFNERRLVAETGAEIVVLTPSGEHIVARLQVVDAFPGSANVTGLPEALANIAVGDRLHLRQAIAANPPASDASTVWVDGAGSELEKALTHEPAELAHIDSESIVPPALSEPAPVEPPAAPMAFAEAQPAMLVSAAQTPPPVVKNEPPSSSFSEPEQAAPRLLTVNKQPPIIVEATPVAAAKQTTPAARLGEKLAASPALVVRSQQSIVVDAQPVAPPDVKAKPQPSPTAASKPVVKPAVSSIKISAAAGGPSTPAEAGAQGQQSAQAASPVISLSTPVTPVRPRANDFSLFVR